MLLCAKQSGLLVVDVQEKLIPMIYQQEMLINHCAWLIKAAYKLNVPVIYSEQYPKGLGATVKPLKELLTGAGYREKIHFSCGADSSCRQMLTDIARKQIVIIGIEAHVCVLQTAIDLFEQGYRVFVAADCISSRALNDKKLALKRLRQQGIIIVSREMVLFEWLRQAGTVLFKEVSQEFLK